MLATLVQVPEINGQFIELATIVDEDQLHDALADVRAVLGELGIEDGDLTTEQYTDAVAALRAARAAGGR
jgi:adenylate cyclase class 2